jgi:hypothetical protein
MNPSGQVASGFMEYYWETDNANLILWRENEHDPGMSIRVAGVIYEGPNTGFAEVTYRVTGRLIDEDQRFPTSEEARRAVEQVVEEHGGRIVKR